MIFLQTPLKIDDRVVPKVFSDTGKVMNHLYAQPVEEVLIPDARKLQYRRRTQGTGAEEYF